MPRSQDVATGVLTTPLPEGVSDALWRTASPSSHIVVATPVSKTLALSSAKKDGWLVATIQADSATDPEVLAKLARDPRKQVRRSVAANRRTAQADLAYLFEWAISHIDTDTLSYLAPHISLTYLMSALESFSVPTVNKVASHQFWNTVGPRIAGSDDRKVAEAALALEAAQPLHLTLAPLLGKKHPDNPLTLRRLVVRHAGDERMCRELVERGLTGGELSADVADLVCEYASNTKILAGSGRAIGPEAVRVLLTSDRPETVVMAARGATDSDQIDHLIDTGRQDVLVAFVERDLVDMNRTQVDRVIADLEGMGTSYSARDILTALPKDRSLQESVSPRTLVTLLRHATLAETLAWMRGKFHHQPLAGQVASLVATPGLAFDTPYPYYRTSSPATSTTESAQVAHLLEGEIDSLLDMPFTAELVEALGVGFFDIVRPGTARAAYLTARLREGIGISPHAWEVAFGLLDSFGGSLDQLLSSTRRLLKASGDTIVPDPVVCDAQLSLLDGVQS